MVLEQLLSLHSTNNDPMFSAARFLILLYFSCCLFFSCSTSPEYASQQRVAGDIVTEVQGERINDSEQATRSTGHSFPDPVGYVSDFENLYSIQEQKIISELITAFEDKTSNQIAIATIPDLGNYDNIDDLSFDLANFWGVGQRDKDNGVLLVISSAKRKVSIKTGYGVEKLLTDQEAKSIIDNVILPEFKKGEFYKGTQAGLLNIIKELGANQ